MDSKLGVCREFSVLYASLTRAVGIPTRLISGKAKNNKGVWGKHQWNEVLIANEWVPVDVTFGAGLYILDTNQSDKYFDPPPDLFFANHIKHKILSE